MRTKSFADFIDSQYKTEPRVKRPKTDKLNRLFVYGIFLGSGHRETYHMTNPRYATVKDWATVPIGGYIVAAVPLKGYDLTGLVVDIDPDYWEHVDMLEGGYDRIKVETRFGDAWMYIKPRG